MNPTQTNTENNTPKDHTVQPAEQSNDSKEHPKKSKVKKLLLALALLIVTVPLIGYILIAITFAGGIGGVISSLKPAPNPNSQSIIAKRKAAIGSINHDFSALDEKAGVKQYASSTHDRCYKGVNDWKVHDGYAHRCTYRVTKYYGFNGDFRDKMIDFEKTLYGLGWKPPVWQDDPYPMQEIMEHYYDKYYGVDAPQLRDNFPNGYHVSDLPQPTGGYEKGDAVLDIEYAEKETKDLFEIEFTQGVTRATLSPTYERKDFQENIQTTFQKITQDYTYILVISIQEDYFQN